MTDKRARRLLEANENVADLAAVRGQRADEAAAGGYEAAKASYYTADEAKRILAGESPIRVWRQKRGLTQRALAEAAAIQPGYLSEIENGKKPGSVPAYQALAHALSVRPENPGESRGPSAIFRGILPCRLRQEQRRLCRWMLWRRNQRWRKALRFQPYACSSTPHLQLAIAMQFWV